MFSHCAFSQNYSKQSPQRSQRSNKVILITGLTVKLESEVKTLWVNATETLPTKRLNPLLSPLCPYYSTLFLSQQNRCHYLISPQRTLTWIFYLWVETFIMRNYSNIKQMYVLKFSQLFIFTLLWVSSRWMSSFCDSLILCVGRFAIVILTLFIPLCIKGKRTWASHTLA